MQELAGSKGWDRPGRSQQHRVNTLSVIDDLLDFAGKL